MLLHPLHAEHAAQPSRRCHTRLLRWPRYQAAEPGPRDPHGFVLTGPDLLQDGQPPPGWPLDRLPLLLETSPPGVFAAGDVRHRSIKRVASAVGEGSIAVQLANQYLAQQ
jgi:NADPH-dependent glutamate synthase beta subunit-like oxidoreductase